MDKKEKTVRLVDVGELETELDTLLDLMLRDFADETDETKCHCQAVAMESEDLKKLPTIDPETLRPVARLEPVDPESDVEFKCSKCEGVISADWDGSEYFEYCPYRGARTGESI